MALACITNLSKKTEHTFQNWKIKFNHYEFQYKMQPGTKTNLQMKKANNSKNNNNAAKFELVMQSHHDHGFF